jgi:hypothetical protein
MKWEIGRTYRTKGGYNRKVVAVLPDGRLIVEDRPFGRLSYRQSDGTFVNSAGARVRADIDLVNPDEPTPEEQKFIADLVDAFGLHSWRTHISSPGTNDFVDRTVAKVLEVIRERR